MILCVDPDDTARARTREALAEADFETAGGASVADARAALEDGDVECVVTEYGLPDGTGLDLVQAVRETSPDTTCVLFTETPLDDVDTASSGGVVAEYLDRSAPDALDRLTSLVEHSVSFLSQTAYPLPPDEDTRLDALARYTTAPDALDDALDRLTSLAAALFDLDQSFVGLVDAHHERFVSCFGGEFDELPREQTACTYAILDDDVTVFEDVANDPRFESNDALAAAGIGFYAGAPLLTDDGAAIGSFCVAGAEPRSFPASDRDRLRALADEAMSQFELHRLLSEADVEVPA